jgi:hypothetical protein
MTHQSIILLLLSNVAGREMDLEDLAHQGITVDDENKPGPENTNPHVEGAPPPKGTWEKPAICPHCANMSATDNPGKWKNHQWDQVAEYDELCLFQMCFPEVWIVKVLIPVTNRELVDKLSLQEFYVFWGIIFFISCFNGIKDRELWWSTKQVDMFSGAPFQFNQFMIQRRFCTIMSQ